MSSKFHKIVSAVLASFLLTIATAPVRAQQAMVDRKSALTDKSKESSTVLDKELAAARVKEVLKNPDDQRVTNALYNGGLLADFKPENEDVSLRSASAKHFRNADGTMTAIIGAGDFHYSEAGQWKTILPFIFPNTNGEFAEQGFASEYNKHKSYFPTTPGNSIVTVLGTERYEDWGMPTLVWLDQNGVEMAEVSAQFSSGNATENQLIYEEIYPEIDAQIINSSTTRKLNYILKNSSTIASRPSGAKYLAFRETLTTPTSWTMEYGKPSAHGTIHSEVEFKDAFGKSVLVIQPPVFHDRISGGQCTDPGFETAALNDDAYLEGDYFVKPLSSNQYQVFTRVEVSWLAAEQRRFPLTIDPTTNFYPGFTWPTYTAYRSGNSGNWVCNTGAYGNRTYPNSDISYGWVDTSFPTSNPYLDGYASFDLAAIPDNSCLYSVSYNWYRYGGRTCGNAINLKLGMVQSNINLGNEPDCNITGLSVRNNNGYYAGTGNNGSGWHSQTGNLANLTAALPVDQITIGWAYNGGDDCCTFICAGDDGDYHNVYGFEHPTLKPYAQINYETQSTTPTTISGATTVCNGGSTTLTASGGTLGTSSTYQWYAGGCGSGSVLGTGASLTVTPSGNTTYFVRRTGPCNTTGCTSVAVTVLPAFSAGNITGGGGSICTPADPGSMTVSPSGGTGTYTYQWYSIAGTGCPSAGGATPIAGATSASYDPPSGLTATTSYQVQVNPAGSPDCGAAVWSSNCVTVTVKPIPVATATNSAPSICSGGSTNIGLSSSLGSTTYVYTVSASSGTIGGFSNGSVTPIVQTLTNSGTTSGTVTYTITPTSAGCAGSPITVVVTVKPTPNVVTTPSISTICSGLASNVALTSGVSGTTYAWTASSGNPQVSGYSASSGSTIAQTLSNSGSVQGTVTYTITPTAASCPGPTGTATVNVNPLPQGSIVGSTTICNGLSTNLTFNFTTGTPPYDVIYSNGVTTFSLNDINSGYTVSVNPTSTTTYTLVSIIDAAGNGCTRTSGFAGSSTITVNPRPVGTISGATTICAGLSTTLTFNFTIGTGPFNVSYSDGTTTYNLTNISNGHTVSVNPSTTTTYSIVSITDANNCSNSTIVSSAVVTVRPAPNATMAIVSPICFGNQTTITFTFTAGTGPFNVNFTDGVSNYSLAAITTGSTFNVTPPTSVTYNFTSITDNFGCVRTTGFAGSAQIIVNPLPTVSFSGLASSYCQTASPITITGNQAPLGTFTGPGITNNGNGTATFNPSSAGVGPHIVSYAFTDINTCSNTYSQPVLVDQQPVANAGAGGNECDLDFTFSAVPTVGIGTWTKISGPGNAFFSDVNSATSGVQVTAYGTYVFRWREVNGQCSDSQQITVNFYQQPVANAGAGGSECDLDFSLAAVASVGTGTWSQLSGPGTSSFGNANAASTTVTVSASGTYVFRWQEVNGTCSNSANVTVNFYSQPVANPGTGGNECDLDFVFSAVPSFGNGTWTQTNGPGTSTFSNANDPNSTVSVSAYGTYTYRWTEVNGTCSNFASITVTYYLQPVANAGVGGNECDLDYQLIAVPSIGTGAWTQTSGPGTSSFSSSTASTSTVTVSQYGTYQFTWTEINGTCSNATSVTVNFYQQPVANAGLGGSECDLDFVFSAVPSVGTGVWTQTSGPGTSSFAPNANNPAATVTVSQIGAYQFTWTETNGTCSNSAAVTVNFYQQSVADAGNGGDECDLNFVLNAVPTVGTGVWTQTSGTGFANYVPNASSPTATVSVSGYGAYQFTWTETNGSCSSSDNVNVNFYQQPVANAGTGGNECDLNFVFSAIPSAGVGTWTQVSGPGTSSFVNSNSPTTTVTVSSVGQYVYQWQEVNGTCIDASTVTVNYFAQPVANAGFGGSECDLDYSLAAVPSVGIGTWTATGPGTISYSPNANDPNAVATVSTYGIYIFTWTENNFGCTSSANITVQFNQQTNANAGSDGNECDLNFTFNGSPSIGTGVWTYAGPGNAFFSNLNSPTATVTVDTYGSYLFTWTETNGNCVAVDQASVNFYQQPVANPGTGGNECDLNFQFSAVPSSGTGTWILSNGPGTATFTSASNPTTLVTVSQYGTYLFTWIETNGTCSSQAAVTVNFYQQPVANAGTGGNECDLNFTFNGTASVGVGLWTASGPGTATFANDLNVNTTVTVSAYGTYTFTWTEINGTCSSSSSVTVNFYQQPIANAGVGGNECDLNFVLNAVPSVGTGVWTQTAGPGVSSFGNASSPTAVVTVSTYGTYQYAWTETNGSCSDFQTVTVNYYQQPVANAGIGGSECDLDFNLAATPSVGTGVWTSSGPGTATFGSASSASTVATVSLPGVYTFTWTETNGVCSNASSVNVTFYNQPVANAGTGGTECDLDFTFNGTPSFGTGVWTYTGPGTAAFTNANSATSTVNVSSYGSYLFTWTETNGICSNNASVTVNFYQQPVANPGTVTNQCDLDFTFNAVPSVGTGTWTYTGPGTASFVPNANTATATVTVSATGSYTFTWTEVNNACSSSASRTIAFNALPSVSFTGLAAQYCVSSTTPVPLVGSPSGGTFTGLGISGNSFIPSVAGVGTISITYTYTDVNGCTNAQTQSVIVNDIPTVSFTGLNPSYCVDDAVAHALTGSPAGGTFTGSGISGGTFTPSVANVGSHIITYTYVNQFGCSSSQQQTTAVNQLPTVSFTGLSSSYCMNASNAPLTGIPAGGTFSGTGIIGGAFSPVAAGIGTHTIIYTYTNSNGCTNTSSQQVTVNPMPVPVITPSGNLQVCAGSTIALNAGSGFAQYSWSNNQNGQTIAVGTAGTYSVTVTTAAGCSATSPTVNVSVNALPIVNLGADTVICTGHVLNLNAGNPGSTYSWSTFEVTQSINVTASGVYTATVTNSNGCVGTDNIAVTVSNLLNPVIVANGPVVFCAGQSVTLNAGAGYANYSWSNGATTQTITVSTAGVYEVVVTDQFGCGGTDDETVATMQLPNAVIQPGGSISICNSDTVTLSASNTFSAYSWNPGGATTSSIPVWQSGSYTVTVTDPNNGCVATSAPVVVTVNTTIPPTIVASGATSFCDGGSVSLSVIPGPYNSYLWTSGSTTPSIVVTESGNYGVTVQDANGCLDSTLLGNPLSITVWDPTPNAVQQGDSIVVTNGPFGQYQWFYNGAPLPGATGPVLYPSSSGNYYVQVWDSHGCDGTSYNVEFTFTGIADMSSFFDIHVYPNPTHGSVSVVCDFGKTLNVEFCVYDIAGRSIIKPETLMGVSTFRREIDMGSLSLGVYYLKINTTHGVVVKPIIRN